MKENPILKAILPYLTAIVIFSGVAAIYFAPQYEGKSLSMHDNIQYLGASSDIRSHIKEHGEDPQWTGNVFGGMPSYMIHFDYKTDVIKGVDKLFHFLGNPAAYLFISMLSFLLMLVMWGVNPWVGLIPSLAYGLSTYSLIIIGAGHLAKVMVMAYIPLVVGAVYYTYRRDMWFGGAMAALAGSLVIVANHPQIVYYFLFVLVAFWINELVRSIRKKIVPHFVKATLVLALAGALAAGANLSPLWYTAAQSRDSARSGSELKGSPTEPSTSGSGVGLDYATQWSYGKAESFNMLIPNLMGGASDGGFSDDGAVAQVLTKYQARGLIKQLPPYWGEQPMTAGPTYIGAVIIFLAVVGFFLLRGRSKWWILAISALALMLSWGKNMMWFTELFYNYFPLYNKFRTVSMILVVLQWSVPFVAALGLCRIYGQQQERKKLVEAIKKSLYIVGGAALLFALAGGALFSFSSPYDPVDQLPADLLEAMRSERAQILRSDAVRSLIYILLTATLLWLFVAEKIKRGLMVTLLALLVVLDLVTVDLRYMPQSRFVESKSVGITATQADEQIMQDKSLGYRVFNMTVSPFNDATTSNFHRSVGGYHSAKLKRYQDIIDRYLTAGNQQVLNMLNTKYFITQGADSRPVVQLNEETNGAAWVVDSVLYVSGADAEIQALGRINTKRVAVVDERFRSHIGPLDGAHSSATIELTEYRVNHLTYKFSGNSPSLAIFSEIYYDRGWSAYLDGKPTEFIQADYLLRAVYLPAGEHTVEFKFSAPNYTLVTSVTMISGIAIVLLFAAAAIYKIIQYIKKNGARHQ